MRRKGLLAAGISAAVALTLIATDWLLSLEPRFFSTAFGLVALAFTLATYLHLIDTDIGDPLDLTVELTA